MDGSCAGTGSPFRLELGMAMRNVLEFVQSVREQAALSVLAVAQFFKLTTELLPHDHPSPVA